MVAIGSRPMANARRGRREQSPDAGLDGLDQMLERKPVKLVAIALANRMARTIWALIQRGDSYRATLA